MGQGGPAAHARALDLQDPGLLATGPRVFNVRCSEGANREATIFRSKAVGEPPLMLAISVLHALSDAIASVADYTLCPRLDPPATPERVLTTIDACEPGSRSRARGRQRDRVPHPLCRTAGGGGARALVSVAVAKGSTPREAGAGCSSPRGPRTGRSAAAGSSTRRSAAPRRTARAGEVQRRDARGAARAGGRPVLRRPRHASAWRAPGAAELAALQAAEAAEERAGWPLVLLFGAGHVGKALALAMAPAAAPAAWIDGRPEVFPSPAARGRRSRCDRKAADRDPCGARRQRLCRHDPQPRLDFELCEAILKPRRLPLSRADRLRTKRTPLRARLRELGITDGADRAPGLPDRRSAAGQAAGRDRSAGRGRAADDPTGPEALAGTPGAGRQRRIEYPRVVRRLSNGEVSGAKLRAGCISIIPPTRGRYNSLGACALLAISRAFRHPNSKLS